MIRMVIGKIKNKKWLNLCLLVGVILITAMFSCHPLLEKGAGNKLIRKSFMDYAQKNREFPMVVTNKSGILTSEYNAAGKIFEGVSQSSEASWKDSGVGIIQNQIMLSFQGVFSKTEYQNKGTSFNIQCLKDVDEHIRIVKGEGLEETIAYSNDQEEMMNIFPCFISEKTMDVTGLVVGEKIYIDDKNFNATVTLVVVGICVEESVDDFYWHDTLSDMEKTLLISEETMDAMQKLYNGESIFCKENIILNYTQVKCNNIDSLNKYIRFDDDSAITTNFGDIINNFTNQRKTVKIILFALELPCLVIILLFIYMIISQIVNLEEGEIAMLRSRGISALEIVGMYLLHGFLLCTVGCAVGFIIGYVLCKISAFTDTFLSFSYKDASTYTFEGEMILYGLFACLIVIIFIVIIAFKKSNITIIHMKSKGNFRVKVPVWEKYFLDVILTFLSLYLLYNHMKQNESIARNVISAEGIDPLIFLNLSLFIFACSLLFLRLQKYLILAIDKLGKKHWSVSLYVSFIQMKRDFYKQGFLSVFLIMTLACGVFNSNMARTINENSEQRILYNTGTDLVITEKFSMHTYKEEERDKYRYDDIDFDKYLTMVSNGIVDSVTKVIVDDKTSINNSMGHVYDCKLLGINTKEFGETAKLKEGLNKEHWFHALNALAVSKNGAILSRALADEINADVGDVVTLNRYSAVSAEDEIIGNENVEVVAIIDCFPGCDTKKYIVSNYAMLISSFGITPYEIWARMGGNTNSEKVHQYINENEINVMNLQFSSEKISENRESALFQITNGMFSISFIISLIVCCVGFLMYWIMSIRDRSYVFGVYRAMGMRMKEVYMILFIEQLFSSLVSLVAGFAVGFISTGLFAKLLAIVYLPEEHNIPISLVIDKWDIVRLLIIVGILVLICFLTLQNNIRKLKISKAIRM